MSVPLDHTEPTCFCFFTSEPKDEALDCTGEQCLQSKGTETSSSRRPVTRCALIDPRLERCWSVSKQVMFYFYFFLLNEAPLMCLPQDASHYAPL